MEFLFCETMTCFACEAKTNIELVVSDACRMYFILLFFYAVPLVPFTKHLK